MEFHPRLPGSRLVKAAIPAGAQKKLRSLRAELDAEFAEAIHVKEGGQELVVSKQRAFVKALVSAAIQGDASGRFAHRARSRPFKSG